MSKFGRFTPDRWGRFMPVHSPLSHAGPWYYRNTEMVMAEFETDPDAVLDLLPAELELMEPATAFMVMEQNHWTTVGPYGEVYIGVMCLWEGVPHAYVPGVYVTGENSQIIGREVWGFGKKRASRFELISHGNGEVEALMEITPGDRALRAVMKPQANAPADSIAEIPLICLRVVPDAEGGDVPALAQLVSVTFKSDPLIGTDGKAEILHGARSAPARRPFGCPTSGNRTPSVHLRALQRRPPLWDGAQDLHRERAVVGHALGDVDLLLMISEGK